MFLINGHTPVISENIKYTIKDYHILNLVIPWIYLNLFKKDSFSKFSSFSRFVLNPQIKGLYGDKRDFSQRVSISTVV